MLACVLIVDELDLGLVYDKRILRKVRHRLRRLSDGVEAALHCSLVLAGLPAGKVLPGKSLAELHGVSETYLLKHLRSLAAHGVADALPGPRGGYRLSRPPEQISLFDIVQAIDGSEPAFVCREIRRRLPGAPENACAYKTDCFIKIRMLAAEEAWRDALREQTLADLVDDAEKLVKKGIKVSIARFVEKNER